MSTDLTIDNWTRAKNDAIHSQYKYEVENKLFRHITYGPDYLREGSCAPGNTSNCAVFQAVDLDKESRIGVLTNKKFLQRASTNDKAMGILTVPGNMSGPLLDGKKIDDMVTIESQLRSGSRVCDIPASSTINERGLDLAVTMPHHNVVSPWDTLYSSTRVARRNACSKRTAGEGRSVL